jgi:nicotinate-nucleotide--dimethylbenzimidazole phosphoribosyltransferase
VIPLPGAHGGDGLAVAASLGLDPAEIVDLSASLNPFAPDLGPLLHRYADALGRYPDPRVATAALAEAMGVDPDRLLLTNGGSQAIDLVGRVLGGRVAAEPEFSLYPRSTSGPVWRSDPHSPSGMLAGPTLDADVWDEAFYPLATGRWTAGREAVVVGSLTKLFACPGLRLGYVIADDVGRFARLQPEWSVGSLALAILGDLLALADLPEWAKAIEAQRHRLTTLLAAHGLDAFPSDAPWVLVESPGLRDRLAPHGVVVRDCASFGLPTQARIAVPDDHGLARLAAALEHIHSQSGGGQTMKNRTDEHDEPRWPRPVPVIGDRTSAAERSGQTDAWRLDDESRRGLYQAIHSRRDIRRYRPDALDDELVTRILEAAHAAPSVGHSQPWRFILVRDPSTRDRAAWVADQERLAQAKDLTPAAGRHLLDLQLEGIREAPMGIVVCCDRRVPAAGVLGRRTFPDADLWSCICAIENLWLAARAEGLGVGWVTLFPPDELASLLDLPAAVVPLGWLCLGWPDERPPDPGLERVGWSKRLPLTGVVMRERWSSDEDQPEPPVSKLRAPDQRAVVAARDSADALLTPLGSLGVLDRAVDRVVALGHPQLSGGTLVLVGGHHPVAELGVSAFHPDVTDEILDAARAGVALGAVAATGAGLGVEVVDAGWSTGNLRDDDALDDDRVRTLLDEGIAEGRRVASRGIVALGEVGVGNTTVAAALTALLLGLDATAVVGLGAGADSAVMDQKRTVVAEGVARARQVHGTQADDPFSALASLGGPEFAFLSGVSLGAAEQGAPIVLDGLATSVAALIAVLIDPAVASHLIAGQMSRELAHAAVLGRLGLEPLLDLRFRAGEGAGACLAANLVFQGLRIRSQTACTE